jgi:hypothetical protein
MQQIQTVKGEVKFPELLIQKNDLLSIQVYSLSTKSEIDQLYNLQCGTPTGGNAPSTVVFL